MGRWVAKWGLTSGWGDGWVGDACVWFWSGEAAGEMVVCGDGDAGVIGGAGDLYDDSALGTRGGEAARACSMW